MPAKSIVFGSPARIRLTGTTTRERMVFFHGRDWPAWERQATEDELQGYKLPGMIKWAGWGPAPLEENMSHAGFVKYCGWLMLAACPAWAHQIDPRAEIHPTAVLIGNVTVGAYTKIGPKAVIQGDITIGHHVNILGNAVVSADQLTIGNYVRIDYGARVLSGRPGDRQYVRDNCWIGMNATVRGSRMEEGSAVGNGAVADFNTHLEKGAVLAHGATTGQDTTIAANALAEGRPAKITRSTAADADRDKIFGLIPARWIHYENDKIAGNIDANPRPSSRRAIIPVSPENRPGPGVRRSIPLPKSIQPPSFRGGLRSGRTPGSAPA